MSKETEGKTSAGQTTTIKVPEAPKQSEGVVSKPMGGLYAGPASGQSTGGPMITSTASLQGHPDQTPQRAAQTEVDKAAAEQRDAQSKEVAAREVRAREMAQAKPSEAQQREHDARKKGVEVLAKHDKAMDKARDTVAERTPEGKTGHSISPTVRLDEEMLAAKAMAKHIDLATGEKDRPMRYDPEAPISHSILPTVREDEELGIIPKDKAITKEEAEKKTDYDTWVNSNERQQTPFKRDSSARGGEYDGEVTVSFHTNKGYHYEFAFDLPNIIGTLGIVGMNDDAIRSLIENALITRLGTGGVVRRNDDKPAKFPQGQPQPAPTFSS